MSALAAPGRPLCKRLHGGSGVGRRGVAPRTAAAAMVAMAARRPHPLVIRGSGAQWRQQQQPYTPAPPSFLHQRGARQAVVIAASAAAAAASAGDGGSGSSPSTSLLPAARLLAPLAAAAAAAAPRALALADAHFLPLCLAAGVAAGAAWPAAGVAAARLDLATAVTFCLFVISGLQLRRDEMARALEAKGALLYGLLTVLLITPLLAIPVLQLPLEPRALSLGLAVFCCVPTALSSGITYTAAIGGNVAVALLLTVASNSVGVFTMPLLLPLLLGGALPPGVTLEPAPLLKTLVAAVLLPTALGALARARVPGLAAAVDGGKPALARACALLLALVPWTQVSRVVAAGIALTPQALLLSAAAGLGIHLAYLALNAAACRLLRLGGRDEDEGEDGGAAAAGAVASVDGSGGKPAVGAAAAAAAAAAALARRRSVRGVRRAVVLTASAKTLPVAVAVFSRLAPALGGLAGAALVPVIAAHIIQLAVDSVIVARWKERDAAEAAAAAAAAEAEADAQAQAAAAAAAAATARAVALEAAAAAAAARGGKEAATVVAAGAGAAAAVAAGWARPAPLGAGAAAAAPEEEPAAPARR